ncbi:hypothetical protein NIES4071_70740 [Calothrix sp. NIES-4071]|nr:hypothetical protein NIES4071_70740 [Calothrix sp. NIES-4071]BAZ61349.1 hypothetical protein NIES4105_70690 [Calothrix sp. NIES-4105]
MTKNPFDQFSKQFFKECLSSLGEVKISEEIPGESRFVDIWFIPSLQAPTDSQFDLGILARIAETPCLLEPFRNQPTKLEIRSCLAKLFHLEAEIRRETRRDEDTLSEDELPRLWIIATSCSDELLSKLPAYRDSSWPNGIYFAGEVLLTRIVAIDKLPATPETLWLRILGKGLIQKQAVDDVVALPKGNPKRSKILSLLYNWKINMEISKEIDIEDKEELIMNLSQAYLEWEQETVERGKEIGKEQGQRQVVENLLMFRFGSLDPELQAIIASILALSPSEFTPMLMQLSREELITRFATQN